MVASRFSSAWSRTVLQEGGWRHDVGCDHREGDSRRAFYVPVGVSRSPERCRIDEMRSPARHSFWRMLASCVGTGSSQDSGVLGLKVAHPHRGVDERETSSASTRIFRACANQPGPIARGVLGVAEKAGAGQLRGSWALVADAPALQGPVEARGFNLYWPWLSATACSVMR
jgi:hypothetical protein